MSASVRDEHGPETGRFLKFSEPDRALLGVRASVWPIF